MFEYLLRACVVPNAAKLVCTLAASLCAVFAASLITAGAQPPMMEIIRSKCDVMQDVVDNLVANYADPERIARGDDKISKAILDRLSATDFERVEKLFRCFFFEEQTEFGERDIWTHIPVATLNIPTTAEKKEYWPVRKDAWLFIRKKQDGTMQVRGEYRSEH